MAGRCDHKFIDSRSCVKCGWTPERGHSDGDVRSPMRPDEAHDDESADRPPDLDDCYDQLPIPERG